MTVVPVQGPGSMQARLDVVLRQVEGPYVAILPSGSPIEEMSG